MKPVEIYGRKSVAGTIHFGALFSFRVFAILEQSKVVEQIYRIS